MAELKKCPFCGSNLEVLPNENRFKMARMKYNQHGKQNVTTVHEQTGISASLISALEQGSNRGVSYLTIVELAKYYGVSTDYLVGLSDAPTIIEAEVDDG